MIFLPPISIYVPNVAKNLVSVTSFKLKFIVQDKIVIPAITILIYLEFIGLE